MAAAEPRLAPEAAAAEVPDLRLEGVEVVSPEGRVLLAVDRLAVPAGQSVAVTGPSGAGKSTLLYLLAGLLVPARGRVLWGATDLAQLSEAGRARFRRERMGLIFQDYHLFEELSALGNAALAAAFAPRAARPRVRQAAADWLGRLGLGAGGGRAAATFSGGERQRIAVARALAGAGAAAGGPAVVLADEPTASLDRVAADALGRDLAALAGQRTLIAVTHDEALAARLARQVRLVDGRIARDSHG